MLSTIFEVQIKSGRIERQLDKQFREQKSTKIEINVYASMRREFQTKTTITKLLGLRRPKFQYLERRPKKKSRKQIFSVTFHKYVVSYSIANSIADWCALKLFFVLIVILRYKNTVYYQNCNAEISSCSYSVISNYKQFREIFDETS